jgi:hypothetical protein
VADEGIVRMRQAYKEAKPEYRDYLTHHDSKRLETLTNKAKAATAAKAERAVSA